MSRLRIGHTHLTHNYILEGNGAPVCDQCDCVLSVEHILVHCSKFVNQRQRYHLNGKSVAEILADSVDVESLMAYLHEINVFNKI